MFQDELDDFDYDDTLSSDLLDREQVEDLHHLFHFFSQDPSYFSSITSSKLKTIFDKMGLGITISQCDNIIAQNSKLSDKEGEMSFQDFLVLYGQANTHRSHADEMKAVFNLLDDNGDGFVEIPKLRRVLNGLMVGDNPEQQTRNILNTAFPEEHELRTQSFREFYAAGKLSYEEFVKFMMT